MPQEHALERRATKMASAMKQRITTMKDSLTAGQGRIPFHTKLSEADALVWWEQHRYDELGAQRLATMDPVDIGKLDVALTRQAQSKDALGIPTVTEPGGLPGG